ncbi:F-box only protein 47 [Desmophyllum pertusum]|uniref:F-box only protein 47 n=1 Tax=Desmophyllum pertusum TaxID=174260 RepID=A0A9X0A027_9CNID|nr:F-box only protein 47 [Desmophyllum pertusum]
MRFRVFSFTPLSDLGQLSLSSRNFTEEVMKYIHNNDALLVIVPNIHLNSDEESSQLFVNWKTEYCWGHFRDLGVLLKRSTCLFSTKERLKEVGIILDKLKDTHSKICTTLGSDIAYSCYGKFLHSFVAGWEDDEKFKAYLAIKGASCLDDRIQQVLRSTPGSQPWYERYIRVFCREIFLDKASDLVEKDSGFAYQPIGAWRMSPKLLKLCGESVCFDVLGNKAMNGRVHELSYLGYYLGQVLGQDDIMYGKGKGMESFTSTIKQVVAVMPSNKDKTALISSLFNVWEENILSLGEGLQDDLEIVTPEEQEQVFAASIHNLTQVLRSFSRNVQ